jgi:hypothetical protein
MFLGGEDSLEGGADLGARCIGFGMRHRQTKAIALAKIHFGHEAILFDMRLVGLRAILSVMLMP